MDFPPPRAATQTAHSRSQPHTPLCCRSLQPRRYFQRQHKTRVLEAPSTQAPVTVAAAMSLAVMTSGAMLLAASTAAGPATMQAIISNSACGMGNGTTTAADSPTMYLVSPFIGDSVTMVGGNIGLIFVVLSVHFIALAFARSTSRFKRNPRDASTQVRFPHVSLVFAMLSMQGVMLGGWQLLWLVIRQETEGSRTTFVICFVISIVFPTLFFLMLWRLQTALLVPKSFSTFWRVSVANSKPIRAKRIPYDAVGLDGLLVSQQWLLSFLRATGPTHF